MTDDELRALVREAIARHLGHGSQSPPEPPVQGTVAASVARSRDSRPDPPWRSHPSFGKFLVMRGDQDGGACLIEPAVSCNHCGFCQSYGH
jgi:hypothetical protein